VIVTGSRIAREGAQAQQPVSIINRDAMIKTNIQSLGELLQQLTTGGQCSQHQVQFFRQPSATPRTARHRCGILQVDLRTWTGARPGIGGWHPLGQ